MKIIANYYQQFDADLTRDVPGERYGGWQRAEIEIGRAALVVMHAWEAGTPSQYPGWYRAVEYIPRSQAICREVFPQLLSTVRTSELPVLHVVGGGDYYRHQPGYRKAIDLAGPAPAPPPGAIPDLILEQLRRFRAERVFVGCHNRPDVDRGFANLDFPPEARPLDTEGVAEDAPQLAALCRDLRVNHLIYVGFALNWCLLMSPAGMVDMSRLGFLCSTIRQATTAVENRETAREERNKQEALWRVALAFGFVFDLDDFLQGLRQEEHRRGGEDV
jgi:nicotinamidase-related amidase